MLDTFEILTTSGIVLWSRSSINASSRVINSLINEVFIEERAWPNTTYGVEDMASHNHSAYKCDRYTLKWTLAKDLGLIFVAVYQSLLHLTWVDKLLNNIRTIFVKLYRDRLVKPDTTVEHYAFDEYYDQQLQAMEASTEASSSVDSPRILTEKKEELQDGDTGGPPPPPVPGLLKVQPKAALRIDDSPVRHPEPSSDSSRPNTPTSGNLLKARIAFGVRGSRRSRKNPNGTGVQVSRDETGKPPPQKSSGKVMRKWNADGLADEDDAAALDYSTNDANGQNRNQLSTSSTEEATLESWGSKTKNGQFVLRDLDTEVSNILKKVDAENKEQEPSSTFIGSSLGVVSGYFRNIVGGKTLMKEDLEKPLKAMEEHLLRKNVAREAALRICNGVELEMTGKKTGSFESIEKALRPAIEASLRKILTPTSSLDLLQEIHSVTKPAVKTASPRPYVLSVVGVNGVGKSTNLAKICYFLLQNKFRVLVAACDTFRSGAVEQLNHHVRNLKELSARENVGEVDLYQKGYGKDAANVAKDAVAFAATYNFDVVLIDTAGRRHNDTRLMSSLEKFASFASPDKILMVGEALVGTDSVMQARHFNSAFGATRSLDGFIISKCDTVGDMIGTLVSMVHATGIPVVFLGVGQHYGDLRNLSIPWAVSLLMS